MGKFSGVLLASDFDNTLVYTEEALRAQAPVPPLSEKNRAAIEYFIREGGRFAISTGRALPAFLQYADQVPMNAPGVVCNGAALYDFDKGEYLAFSTLDEVAITRGQTILNQFPQIAVEAYHIGNTIYGVQVNHITHRHQRLTSVSIQEAPSLTEVPLPLGKLLFEGEQPDLKQAAAFLTEQGWADDYELSFSTPNLLEMTRKGTNKGSMIRELASRLGIPMDHVYCAGDEANDISMLTAAAQGFAPANRNPVVDATGAVIVADARQDAIAEVISILEQRYS